MKIKTFTTKDMATNCYLIIDVNTKDAIIVDPGDKLPRLLTTIQSDSLNIKAVVLTHAHFDHIAGLDWLRENISAPLICGADEAEVLKSPTLNLSPYFGGKLLSYKADKLLNDNEEFSFGSLKFKTIFTPGHTQGGICLYFEAENVLISGDSLFALSIGRTDFPGGSYEQLISSLKERIITLPEETVVFPGHGPKTTIKTEKLRNPYVSL